jgi:glutaredoxin 3
MEEITMIKVYSTPTCPWCTMAKKYLDSKNMEFVDVDVSSDRTAAAEMVSKSGQRGVPVIDINGSVVIGFDKDKIDSLING